MDKVEHRKKTVSGLKWNMLDQLYGQVLTFILGIVLMRLLKPEQFGLLGMVTVFSGFLNVFADFGLSNSLIQRKDIESIDKSTIFWVNCLLGAILASILFFGSSFLADFYNEPELKLLARVLSLSFLFSALGSVQTALLRKELSYQKLFLFSAAASTLSGIFALALAYYDFGVWALVGQQLTYTAIWTLSVWIFARYYPKIEFSQIILKKHLRFGLPLFGSNTFNYWVGNGDNIMAGKFLGAQPLGLYSRAYTLVTLPTHRMSGMISSVMFPSFSQISNDKERVRLIYLKMSRFMATIIFPLMGILIVFAKPIVEILVGTNWIQIIPIIQVLAGVAAIKSIHILNGSIMVSQGRTDLDFLVNLITGISLLICFFIGVQFGIFELAIAYLIGVLIVIFPAWYFTGKLIRLSIFEIARNIFPQFIVTVVLVGLGLYANISSFSEFSNIQSILIYPIIFLATWLLLIFVINNRHMAELKLTLLELINKK